MGDLTLAPEIAEANDRPATTHDWLYAKIFWPGDLDAILLDRIGPWITTLQDQLLTDRFFFVRYWEAGQHLRLRCRLTPKAIQTDLQNELIASIDAFAVSQSSACDWSVKFDSYMPEALRYGGPDAMDSAEAYFEASSRATLALLPSCRKSASYRISAAIELLLLQLLGAGLSPGQCASFCKCTLLILYQYFSKDAATEVLESYTRKWEANQAPLTLFAQKLLSPRAPRSGLGPWMKFCRKYWESLYRSAEAGTLPGLRIHPLERDTGSAIAKEWGEALGFSWEDLANSLAPAQRTVLPILLSHVHMTNNRLGVVKQDEPFVGFLVAKTLEQLSRG